MNSLPPFAANFSHTDHPALESIAAYLDGQLPEVERPEMAAHLDSCAACYEIYTESLRFQNDQRDTAQRGVLPFPRKKTSSIPSRLLRPIALPLAAALLVGVGYAVWHQLHLPLEPRSVDVLTSSLGTPGTLTQLLGPFDVTRGAAEELDVNYPVVAFQSGATLVDLRVAIEAGDPEKIHLFAHNLGVLYNHISSFSPEPEKAVVQAAVGRFREGGPSSSKVRLADFRSLETILRTNNADPVASHFELGKWTEAGRLAAYGGRATFFAASQNRSSLRWFRSNPPKPEIQEPLRRIEDAWPEGSLTPPIQAELTHQFEQVIAPYDVSPTVE